MRGGAGRTRTCKQEIMSVPFGRRAGLMLFRLSSPTLRLATLARESDLDEAADGCIDGLEADCGACAGDAEKISSMRAVIGACRQR
jgi:hypothetical protein